MMSLHHRLTNYLLALTLLLSSALPVSNAEPGSLSGVVVAVKAGAALTVKLDDGQELAVQLAELEAPVEGQPHAQRTREVLSQLALNQRAELQPVETYPGRYRVRANGQDLSELLLTRGLAWVDRGSVSNRNLYTLEAQARTAHRGIWHEPKPLPPHEWQRGIRRENYREADLVGLIIGDRQARVYYPANCTNTKVEAARRLLFAREQDAKAAGLSPRTCH